MNRTTAFLEIRDDESWDLSVTSLAAVNELVGLDVMTAFVRAFTHADRIVSLITWFHLSERDAPNGTAGNARSFSTFQAFLIGTLRELASALKDLRTQLILSGSFADTNWTDRLSKWEKWGESKRVNTVRKKYCFHTDHSLFRSGLSALPLSEDAGPVLRGSSRRTRHSHFVLAERAALEGIRLLDPPPEPSSGEAPPDGLMGGTLRVLGEPHEYLDVLPPLEAEFFRVLEAAGVHVIPIRHRGGV
jgi:hypothetical protein